MWAWTDEGYRSPQFHELALRDFENYHFFDSNLVHMLIEISDKANLLKELFVTKKPL